MTKAKNQGNCGSCAAFAATGLHETCMAKAGAPVQGLDLSEQYLVDCGYDGRYFFASLKKVGLSIPTYDQF